MGETKLSISEIHSVELDMIKFVVDFCEQENLHIYLDSGTLLGAVRGGQFLDWDDDADLIMLREDYNVFISRFSEQSKYKIINSDYLIPYSKIYDSSTSVLEKELRNEKELGVYIDVFPVDKLPSKPNSQNLYFNKMVILKKIVDYVRFKKELIFVEKTNRFSLKNLIKESIYRVLNLFPAEFMVELLSKNAQKYSASDSELRTQMIISFKKKKIYKENWFKPGRTINFCGTDLPIPFESEAYLTELYGKDYMIPPSKNKQIHHNFVAYWK